MLLPASQAAILALLVISLLCWGIWANTLKLAGKWRFELYFYDFALGFALLALVAAFTAGSFASSELTFQENFLIAGYRNIAYVLAFRGESDRAFEWLHKAVAYRDSGLSQVSVEPLFAKIHDDPRWLPFLREVGHRPEELAKIEFRVTLPQAEGATASGPAHP